LVQPYRLEHKIEHFGRTCKRVVMLGCSDKLSTTEYHTSKAYYSTIRLLWAHTTLLSHAIVPWHDCHSILRCPLFFKAADLLFLLWTWYDPSLEYSQLRSLPVSWEMHPFSFTCCRNQRILTLVREYSQL
jgi:hypothetical protein